MAKMKCQACGHEFKSKTRKPMCPQGCRLDRAEVIREGEYSTVTRIGGEYEGPKPAKEAKQPAKAPSKEPPKPQEKSAKEPPKDPPKAPAAKKEVDSNEIF